MNIYKSSLWLSDIDVVISQLPELKELNGLSVLITGASGLICSAVVDLFIRYNEKYDGNITILCAGRSEKKMRDRFGAFYDKPYFCYIPYDATNPVVNIPYHAHYIIHGASNASPNIIVKEPVETMVSNFTGLYALLNYSKIEKSKRLLYISSCEIYGKKDGAEPYTEDDYGFIDLLNSRNSYSVSKRAAETLCISFAEEYGVESVIVRPGHIYGPTASSTDKRVSSTWVYDVCLGRDIVMKSAGTQIRSYVYCLDCASAIVKVLLKGENSHAYNISNPNSIISIKEMASILCSISNVQLKMELPSTKEKKAFTPMNNASMDSHNLQNLEWNGCFDAETGFAHTVKIVSEANS